MEYVTVILNGIGLIGMIIGAIMLYKTVIKENWVERWNDAVFYHKLRNIKYNDVEKWLLEFANPKYHDKKEDQKNLIEIDLQTNKVSVVGSDSIPCDTREISVWYKDTGQVVVFNKHGWAQPAVIRQITDKLNQAGKI